MYGSCIRSESKTDLEMMPSSFSFVKPVLGVIKATPVSTLSNVSDAKPGPVVDTFNSESKLYQRQAKEIPGSKSSSSPVGTIGGGMGSSSVAPGKTAAAVLVADGTLVDTAHNNSTVHLAPSRSSSPSGFSSKVRDLARTHSKENLDHLNDLAPPSQSVRCCCCLIGVYNLFINERARLPTRLIGTTTRI
jgi:hypothetical protein